MFRSSTALLALLSVVGLASFAPTYAAAPIPNPPADPVAAGLGGKDHWGDDESVSNALVSSHVLPASREHQPSLGSVPTQTTSRSAGLAVTAIISRPARPTDCQEAPPSSVLNRPFRCVPHHARP